jgi:hypothetical protein
MLQIFGCYTVDEGKEAGLTSEDTSVLVAVQQILQVPAD